MSERRRAPPRVVSLAWPRSAPVPPWLIWLTAVGFLFLAAVSGTREGALCASGGGLTLIVFCFWSNAAFQRERRRLFDELERTPDADVAAALRALFATPLRVPSERAVLQALQRPAEADPVRMLVVCFNRPAPPAGSEDLIEPITITSSERRWGPLRDALLMLGPLMVIAVLLRFVPGKIGMMFSGPLPALFWVVIPIPIAILAYNCLLKPDYLRFTPGRAEELTYPLWRRKADVTAIPLGAGTLVWIDPQRLVVRRGVQQIRLLLRDLHRRKTLLPKLLAVLMSTAPAPALSTDELL